MPNIYQAITDDHNAHRDLLKTLTDGSLKERKSAWDTFFHDVKSHAAAEEETFYSKLMSKTWGQDAARHSVHEHQKLDDLMEEIHAMDPSTDMWMSKVEQLKHDYEHHMEEEENEVFGRAKEVVSEDELDGIGARFLERKAEEAKIVEEKRKDSLED